MTLWSWRRRCGLYQRRFTCTWEADWCCCWFIAYSRWGGISRNCRGLGKRLFGIRLLDRRFKLRLFPNKLPERQTPGFRAKLLGCSASFLTMAAAFMLLHLFLFKNSATWHYLSDESFEDGWGSIDRPTYGAKSVDASSSVVEAQLQAVKKKIIMCRHIRRAALI